MKSIISNKKECYICKTTLNLHKHHIYPSAFRNKSEENGCWVYLCMDHHVGFNGVHTPRGRSAYNALQKLAQMKFEETHSREEFMKIFRRNYLD